MWVWVWPCVENKIVESGMGHDLSCCTVSLFVAQAKGIHQQKVTTFTRFLISIKVLKQLVLGEGCGQKECGGGTW